VIPYRGRATLFTGRAGDPIALSGVDPVPTANTAVPERCVSARGGETMATGAIQRYDTARGIGSIKPNNGGGIEVSCA